MFYKVRSISKKTGLGTIYVIYRDGDGKEVAKTTSVQVQPEHFSTKTGKINGKDPLHPEKNEKVQGLARDFETALRDLTTAGISPTAQAVGDALDLRNVTEPLAKELRLAGLEEVRTHIEDLEKKLVMARQEQARLEAILGIVAVEKPILFADKMEEYKRHLKSKRRTEGSIKTFHKALVALQKFRTNVQLKDFDLQFLNDFQDHLLKKQVYNNSIRDIFTKILGVYRYYAEDYQLPTTFLKRFELVPEKQDEEKILLDDEEIAQIEAVQLSGATQRAVREAFLFQMETGIRWIDIQQVGRATIFAERDGNQFLKIANQKTKKQIEIPLTRKALDILNRNNYQFTTVGQEYYNRALKSICQKCPLLHVEIVKMGFSGDQVIRNKVAKWQAVTSHLARKKFTDNALDKDVTLLALAEYLGHTNTNTLQKHYANKKRHAKKEAYKLLE